MKYNIRKLAVIAADREGLGLVEELQSIGALPSEMDCGKCTGKMRVSSIHLLYFRAFIYKK
jgi:hypothetical protein